MNNPFYSKGDSMKNLFVLFICILMLFAACSDDDITGNYLSPLAGTWRLGNIMIGIDTNHMEMYIDTSGNYTSRMATNETWGMIDVNKGSMTLSDNVLTMNQRLEFKITNANMSGYWTNSPMLTHMTAVLAGNKFMTFAGAGGATDPFMLLFAKSDTSAGWDGVWSATRDETKNENSIEIFEALTLNLSINSTTFTMVTSNYSTTNGILDEVVVKTEIGFLIFNVGSLMTVATQTNSITVAPADWRTNDMTYEILLSGGKQFLSVPGAFTKQ